MHPANAPKRTPTRTEREPFLPLALITLAAPLLWVLHFAVLYLLEGFLCSTAALPAAAIPVTILLATLLCGGACMYLLLAGAACLRRAGAMDLQSYPVLRAAQRLLAGLALLAIVWTSAGALFLDTCAFVY